MNRSEPGQQLKFAIVGCGLVGRKRAAAFRAAATDFRSESGAIELAYVCDSDPSRAAAIASDYPGVQVAADFDTVLSDRTITAVIISTPNAALAPLSLAALRAGKHVLVEKPGALNAGQLRAMQVAAGKADVRVRVGFNHRFHPALQKTRQLVDEGALGPLLLLRARYGHGGRLGYEKEWRANPDLAGGGELIDQGVHLIDLAQWFLGPFATVEGHATTAYWPMAVDDNAFLSLRTAGGQTAWLHASCTEWKNLFSLELYGRNAKIAIDGLGGSYGTERLTLYEMLPEMGPPKTTVFEYPAPDASWHDELEEFCTDIRLGRTPTPGLDEAIATLDIVETIYRKSGFPVNAAPPPLV